MASRFPFPAYANGWFRVAYSDDLKPGELHAAHYLGRDLVLFRDSAGHAHVLDAICPHLGANLGVGGRIVEGDRIRCPFHAWEWGADGACKHVPYSDRLPANARIRAWPTCEKNGLVLVWHHDQDAPPSFELPELPHYRQPNWTPYRILRWTVKSRWLDMNENAVDRAHFVYVHGAHTMPESTVEADGPILRCQSRMKLGTPKGEIAGGIDTTDYGPAFQTVHLTGIIETWMVNTATPIDEETTDVTFAYSVHAVDGASDQHGVGAAIIRDLEKQMHQDIPIWENKAYLTRPMLVEGDGPFGTYRRWMKQFFSTTW
ncbi:MAG: Rieske 2Fe-2S domain-containing protein [bacterium]